LSFEVNDVHRHAELGFRHVQSFTPLSQIAPIIRYHHHTLEQLNKKDIDPLIAFESGVIHLADRIAILIKNDIDIFTQTALINDLIRPGSGSKFFPEAVEAFLSVSKKESFWLTITGRYINKFLESRIKNWEMFLDVNHLYEFAKLFGRVIDFRSSFTAIHSNRVSRIASALAGYSGMSQGNCMLIGIAGLLHDLGKLAVSSEILDKASDLSPGEWNIMRRHSFYTHELLSGIKGFELITRWASCHHERLDGNGYPFHYNDSQLLPGERIIAVADVFTALTEDRPYRPGLSPEKSISIIKGMVDKNALDGSIVNKLIEHLDKLNQIRLEAEKELASEYNEFMKDIP
jgi:response regulator RpfG family c-di-GMP phosphodiesterase